jgi:transposase
VASLSVEGTVDTVVFDVFVHQVLVPALRPGEVVLLDNLTVHHASQIEQAVRQAQGEVIFLPPYSPDFSPIEQYWSKLKTFLRGIPARTTRRLQRALRAGLQTITSEDLRGWFRHCGYQVTTN